MKKLKIVLMTVVVLIAITGSLAAKKAAFCDINPQYYKVGDVYVDAGVLVVQYTCIQVPSTCTYWRHNPAMQPDVYQPCKYGCYYRILGF